MTALAHDQLGQLGTRQQVVDVGLRLLAQARSGQPLALLAVALRSVGEVVLQPHLEPLQELRECAHMLQQAPVARIGPGIARARRTEQVLGGRDRSDRRRDALLEARRRLGLRHGARVRHRLQVRVAKGLECALLGGRGEPAVHLLLEGRANPAHLVDGGAQSFEVEQEPRGVADGRPALQEVPEGHRTDRPAVLIVRVEVALQHLLAEGVVAGRARLEARQEDLADSLEAAQVISHLLHAHSLPL